MAILHHRLRLLYRAAEMYTKKCPSLLENIPTISHQCHHHIRAFSLPVSELRDIPINMSVGVECDERRHMHIYSSFSAFFFRRGHFRPQTGCYPQLRSRTLFSTLLRLEPFINSLSLYL
jgi:hypothetical protein